MNAIDVLADAVRASGYRSEAIVRNYAFADVLDPISETKVVPLAAFTQTPPSYRSAALAAVEANGRHAFDLAREYRSLGAPLLFVISGEEVAVWQVRSVEPPRLLQRVQIELLPGLFETNQRSWAPAMIHRAKAIGAVDREYQLDFVDAGLLTAIEGEIHAKLERLLVDALASAERLLDDDSSGKLVLYRVVFRLLSAKVLQDRRHPLAATWADSDLSSIVRGIEQYYSLEPAPFGMTDPKYLAAFDAAWAHIRAGISFSNISADDLAFIYENTLVTPETRAIFGTHSTPSRLAEYAVTRLDMHKVSLEDLRIYEPFAGAAVFLVSALRHIRDLLPTDWTDEQRHNFLIRRLAGDEREPFACEVARLSLILADYPNHNGWQIKEIDLFEDDILNRRMRAHNVFLCNPPFESFSINERERYPIAQRNHSKPAAVLDTALAARPLALAFVLPRPFIVERQFEKQRQEIEVLYGSVEIVELPDRIFQASKVEGALLIATERRSDDTARRTRSVFLRSTEIADRDRLRFLKFGTISESRTLVRRVSRPPTGDLWIRRLQSLWSFVDRYPRLETSFKATWGLQWLYKQTEAASNVPRPGAIRGVFSAKGLKQFVLPIPRWLDYRRGFVRRGFGQPWDTPKLLVNEARLSRGPWRIGASVDRSGLAYSQQFFGLWPIRKMTVEDLFCFAAVLNGPLANAFIAVHSPAKGIRSRAIEQIPIPSVLVPNLASLVSDYLDRLSDGEIQLGEMLTRIDAAVLASYDLPPRLERELLEFFHDANRPVAHSWQHWNTAYPNPALRLCERLSGRFHPKAGWLLDVFRPLPAAEAEQIRKYGQ
jgi:hypothetical protein